MTILVREFSMSGPCLTLGTMTKRTAKSVTFIDREGKAGRRGGDRLASGLIHTAACRSCRDHAETQYPEGYMD